MAGSSRLPTLPKCLPSSTPSSMCRLRPAYVSSLIHWHAYLGCGQTLVALGGPVLGGRRTPWMRACPRRENTGDLPEEERMAVVAIQRKRKSVLRRFGGRGVTEEVEGKATGGPMKVEEAAASFVPRPMVDRWAFKRYVTADASLVVILHRFGGRSGKLIPAAGGGAHLKAPE